VDCPEGAAADVGALDACAQRRGSERTRFREPAPDVGQSRDAAVQEAVFDGLLPDRVLAQCIRQLGIALRGAELGSDRVVVPAPQRVLERCGVGCTASDGELAGESGGGAAAGLGFEGL
jgi:hypothetical protein